jgi:hypothetical protein
MHDLFNKCSFGVSLKHQIIATVTWHVSVVMLIKCGSTCIRAI